jgi:lipoprotein-anchoring transpeptidase ErfK/SrfK
VRRARRIRRSGLGAALGLVGVLIGAAVLVVLVEGSPGPSSAEPTLPPPPRSAIAPKNVALGPEPVAYWAPVRAPVTARVSPTGPGIVGNVSRLTPEGTRNIVLYSRRSERVAGRLWVEVRLPGVPDDVRGWVPRSAIGGYTTVKDRLVVDRTRLTATLLRSGRPVFKARVGVGAPSTPTPGGHFYVRNQLRRYRSPFYGPIAFGTTARSQEVTDWPAGGFVGIHGTNRPDLIPGRVSHGCIRMANRDILRLSRLMPIGTPLTVR